MPLVPNNLQNARVANVEHMGENGGVGSWRRKISSDVDALIAQGGTGSSSVQRKAVLFDLNSGSLPLLSGDDGDQIVGVDVFPVVAFDDPAASAVVEIVPGPVTVLASSRIDLSENVDASTRRPVSFTGPGTLQIRVTKAGATQGSGVVLVTYVRGLTETVQAPAIYEDLNGVAGDDFQIGGPSGPRLRRVINRLEVLNSTAAVFRNVAFADPVIADDGATKRYVDALPGTSSTTFQIGSPTGPKWKDAAGIFQARNAADAAFVRVQGAPATALDDFVTLAQLNSQGIPKVADAAALTAFDVVTNGMVSGSIVWVESFRDYYSYDPDAGVIIFDENLLVTPSNGVGAWGRMMIPDPFWKTVTRWYIDPGQSISTNPASDENSGTSVNEPLATWAELMRRVAGTTVDWYAALDGVGAVTQGTSIITVHVNSSLGFELAYCNFLQGGALLIYPSDYVLGSIRNVVTATAAVPASNTLRSFTLDAASAAGDAYINGQFEGTGGLVLLWQLQGGAAGAACTIVEPNAGQNPAAGIALTPATVPVLPVGNMTFSSWNPGNQPSILIQGYKVDVTVSGLSVTEDSCKPDRVYFIDCKVRGSSSSTTASGLLLRDCRLDGCWINCSFAGRNAVNQGCLSGVRVQGGGNVTLLNTKMSDVMLGATTTMLQIGGGAKVTPSGNVPVIQTSTSNGFVLEAEGILDVSALSTSGVYGTFANATTRFLLDLGVRGEVVSANVTWCVITTAATIRASQSATPNTWITRLVPGAAVPASATLSDFGTAANGLFNAAVFNRYAQHPFSFALIHNSI